MRETRITSLLPIVYLPRLLCPGSAHSAQASSGIPFRAPSTGSGPPRSGRRRNDFPSSTRAPAVTERITGMALTRTFSTPRTGWPRRGSARDASMPDQAARPRHDGGHHVPGRPGAWASVRKGQLRLHLVWARLRFLVEGAGGASRTSILCAVRSIRVCPSPRCTGTWEENNEEGAPRRSRRR